MAAADSERKFQRELNAGATSLVLLAVLREEGRAMYGYELAKRLDAADGGVPVRLGTLYPVLRSLERQGLLDSRLVPSAAGPARKYYRLTRAGRSSLVRWTAIWERTRDLVDGTLDGEHSDGAQGRLSS